MKKYNFNMVEIALAMVIIAIGISGILGLFSVGVNSRKSAISENNIANAAEYILGLYRAVFVHVYTENISSDILKKIPQEKPAALTTGVNMPSTVKSHIYDKDGVNFDSSTNEAVLPEAFVYAPSRLVNGERVADCEISGTVWRAPIPVNVPDTDEKINMPDSYGVRIYLELSWPLEKPYAQRETKTYVLDIMNPQSVVLNREENTTGSQTGGNQSEN